MSIVTAVIALATWIGLYVGHHVGDHAVQSDLQAACKGAPMPEQFVDASVHPWHGWSWCMRHVAGYVISQAVALGLVALFAPITLIGSVAALVWSGATHAVIDRRWLVRWYIRVTKKGGWAEGPYHVDQSTHLAMLLVAAVLAARIHTLVGLLFVLSAGAACVAAGLWWENRRALEVRKFLPDL